MVVVVMHVGDGSAVVTLIAVVCACDVCWCLWQRYMKFATGVLKVIKRIIKTVM